MVIDSFKTIIFMRPMWRLDIYSGGPSFFLLGSKGGGRGIFLFSHILNVFLSSSLVFQMFPKMIPIEPHFYSIFFGQSWTFMYTNNKGGRLGVGVCGGGQPKGSTSVLLLRATQCFKKQIWWALKLKWLLQQENKKTFGQTSQLINK